MQVHKMLIVVPVTEIGTRPIYCLQFCNNIAVILEFGDVSLKGHSNNITKLLFLLRRNSDIIAVILEFGDNSSHKSSNPLLHSRRPRSDVGIVVL